MGGAVHSGRGRQGQEVVVERLVLRDDAVDIEVFCKHMPVIA